MISFLLPTNRINTHPNIVKNCINSIIENHLYEEIEILIFSEQELDYKYKNIKYIKEIGRQGPIYGFNKMVDESSGDVLICMTDDNIVLENCFNHIDTAYQMGIVGLNRGGCNIIPQKGDKLGDIPLSVDVGLIRNIRWPVITRRFLFDKLDGHIFHPELFYHAGDIYLSFFLDKIGIITNESFSRIDQPIGLKDASFENEDCNTVRTLIENFDINKGYTQKKIL
jgi:hypothetical protein